MLAAKLLSGMGGKETPYVDDVFSAYTYTGNGSTQTITNGIDLAGKGGLVWIKDRGGVSNHLVFDSERSSFDNFLLTNATTQGQVGNYISPGSSGFDLVSSTLNTNLSSYISWTFRKAAKFFDVVTYTGNGGTQNIAHSLGVAPGMLIVKDTSGAVDWMVYHISRTKTDVAYLNLTDAFTSNWANCFGNNSATVEPTASVFTVGSAAQVNATSHLYVAYLFAHDTGTDGIIQCGSFTTDGSGNATVTLGWEPQFVLTKLSTGGTGSWVLTDTSRGMALDSNERALLANTTDAEFSSSYTVDPTATGFLAKSWLASTTYIYLAIRRPNKPPTVGTQVYSGHAVSSAVNTFTTLTSPDMAMTRILGSTNTDWNSAVFSRLVGNDRYLTTSRTNAELTGTGVGTFTTSMGLYSALTASPMVYHIFKRAPGVFDQVCWAGTVANLNVSHSLGVIPELLIVKSRSAVAEDWFVSSSLFPSVSTDMLLLSKTNSKYSLSTFWNTGHSATTFGVGAYANNSGNMVAYLFATKAGISKCGSYTGNGSSQTINCGFTTGARFILIKRTDSTGDWYVWDTVRGIVAGNDPHLSLNTTAAEVTTDDSIDPDASGFIVNQNTATYINVTSATYIYLSFA